MKKIIYLVIILLILSQSLFAKKSNILKEIVNDIEKNELNFEYYMQSPFVFTPIPLTKEDILETYYTEHKVLKYNEYIDYFKKLENIKLKELKPEEIIGIDIVMFLKNKDEVIYTIENGYELGINGKKYKKVIEFQQVLSKIIPEYYGEAWKKKLEEIKLTKTK
jgi:Tfp pilus assembly protein PilP